ncbi:MAG: 6-phosphogluconolactonase [Phycisphaeraceae bacterium]|nr:6-phosphogluconolactonase [Phycisphaeraceae bacterium]
MPDKPRLWGLVIVREERDDLFAELAQLLMRSAISAISARGECHLALSGGTTPEPFFIRLVTDPHYRAFPWEKTHVWLVDERRVPLDHAQSNFGMIREILLDHVVIRKRCMHPIDTLASDPAGDYERQLCDALPDGRLDFVLLGMGDDGHTASLFPHSPALSIQDRWMTGNEGEHVTPPPRVTMTYPLLNAARRRVVLVTGRKKHATLQRISQQRGPLEDLPITGLTDSEDAELFCFLDGEAAGIEPPPPIDLV